MTRSAGGLRATTVLIAASLAACSASTPPTGSPAPSQSSVEPTPIAPAPSGTGGPSGGATASAEPSLPIDAFLAIPRTEGVLNSIMIGDDAIVVGGFSGPTFTSSIQVFADGAWSTASVPDTPGQVAAIAAFGDRFIAVGNTLPDTSTGFTWASTDGRDWELIETLPDAALYDVAVGEGVVVAVGARLDAEMNATASAWTSVDGSTWALATVAEGSLASMGSVTTTADGFAAIGDRRLGQPRPLWTGGAATSWSAPSNDLDDQLLPADLVRSHDGFAIVGASGRSGDQHPFVATSLDAKRWEQTNLSTEECYASAIAVVMDRLVVAGIDADVLTLWWQQGDAWEAERYDPSGASISALTWDPEWGLVAVGAKDGSHSVWVFAPPPT